MHIGRKKFFGKVGWGMFEENKIIMSKELELSRIGAQNRLLLFLKLRKGNVISDKTISDFEILLRKMYSNFKSFNANTISNSEEANNEIILLALKSIRCGHIKWEDGGNSKLSDIDSFSYYKDGKYRAKIKGELMEISERDFKTLQYIVFGER